MPPKLYSYIVARDYGFAPNPFYDFCTLATCKPDIRRTAQVGDWVVGTGPKTKGRARHIVYAMRVTEVMSFNDYWNDLRFIKKRHTFAGRGRRISETISITGIHVQITGVRLIPTTAMNMASRIHTTWKKILAPIEC